MTLLMESDYLILTSARNSYSWHSAYQIHIAPYLRAFYQILWGNYTQAPNCKRSFILLIPRTLKIRDYLYKLLFQPDTLLTLLKDYNRSKLIKSQWKPGQRAPLIREMQRKYKAKRKRKSVLLGGSKPCLRQAGVK